MLFDLLSTDMYVSYNCNLAHIIGLQGAIYISELININRKAIKKDKLKEDYFLVDRDYIEQRTTLTKEDQKSLDKTLEDISLISFGESKDYLKVNIDTLTGLLLEKDKDIVTEVSKIVKRGRPSKKESIARALKSYITTPDVELRSAYENWIDSVMERQGWMNKESVIEGQKVMNDFTKMDLDLALKVLSIASINGYRDISWAINDIKKNNKKGSYRVDGPSLMGNREPLLADEVF